MKKKLEQGFFGSISAGMGLGATAPVIDGEAKIREADWLCPKCKQRPPGNAIKVKNGKAYCIYCNTELDFNREETK